MDVIRGPYYSLNYKILSITGLWPYLSQSQGWMRGTITVILLQTLLIPMWLGLFEAVGDMNLLTECIPPTVIRTSGLIFFLTFVINSKELSTLLEKIERDWVTWSTEPEFKILEKYAKDGNSFRTKYAVFLFGMLAGFLAIPYLPTVLDWVKPLNESRPRTPIYFAKYGIDGEEYYNFIFFHSYSLSCFSQVLLLNLDMIFVACLQHACGVFAAIGSKLTDLVKADQNPFHRGDNCQRRIDEVIIFCAKQHKELIVFLQDIHNCFWFPLLMIVTLNMMIMSVTLFQIAMNLDRMELAIRFAVSIAGQMVHLFLLTISCQQMTDHSLSLSDAAYKSNWYMLPSQSRKLLLMIMRRSSQPIEITVGKTYAYSMKNFAMVVKTSISYFTVLCSVQ